MIACALASIFDTPDSSEASGSWARTRATRSRTSFAAESTLRSGTNSTVIWLTSSRDTDFTVRTPSMPEIESSIGWVICDSVTCGLAPLYTVRTETIGVSILGYSRTERRENEIAPSSTIIRLITVASTGRRMQSSGRRKLAAFLFGNLRRRLGARDDRHLHARGQALRALGDDQVARGDALHDLDLAHLARAGLHLHQLGAAVDHAKHVAILAARHDRLLGDPDRVLAHAERELHAREHAGAQPELRVGAARARQHGARLLVHRRLDRVDRAGKARLREGVDRHAHRQPGAQLGEEGLRHAEIELELVDLFQARDVGAGGDVRAFAHLAQPGRAGERRADLALGELGFVLALLRQRARVRRLQLVERLLADEALLAHVLAPLHALLVERRLRALRGHQRARLGGVERDQQRAALHALPLVEGDALDAPGDLGPDHDRLVGAQAADGAGLDHGARELRGDGLDGERRRRLRSLGENLDGKEQQERGAEHAAFYSQARPALARFAARRSRDFAVSTTKRTCLPRPHCSTGSCPANSKVTLRRSTSTTFASILTCSPSGVAARWSMETCAPTESSPASRCCSRKSRQAYSTSLTMRGVA